MVEPLEDFEIHKLRKMMLHYEREMYKAQMEEPSEKEPDLPAEKEETEDPQLSISPKEFIMSKAIWFPHLGEKATEGFHGLPWVEFEEFVADMLDEYINEPGRTEPAGAAEFHYALGYGIMSELMPESTGAYEMFGPHGDNGYSVGLLLAEFKGDCFKTAGYLGLQRVPRKLPRTDTGSTDHISTPELTDEG